MKRKGSPTDALEFHSDWPRPVCLPGQVLIEVAATSVNAGDWKVRQGLPLPIWLPKILGEDVAGVVAEAPAGSKFKPGDKVFAGTGQMLKAKEHGGTYGEFCATDEATVCLMPPGVSFEEAAAVPVAATTAWQGLEPAMPLAGKRVLVHGGAGGVGGFAIQIAKAQGAHVTTTCSGRNVEYVTQQLGADEAIDYTKGPFQASVTQPFDCVLDTIGGNYEPASLRLIKAGGVMSGLGATGGDYKPPTVLGMAALLLNALRRTAMGRLGLAPKYHFVMLRQGASEGLEQVAALMAEGKLKAYLDRVVPLEEAAAAHEYCQKGHVRGKVVLRVKQV